MPSLTCTNVYPNVEPWPAIVAAISAFHTAGPATPSAVRPWSFSNAITAPCVISPEVPGCHMLCSAAGMLG